MTPAGSGSRAIAPAKHPVNTRLAWISPNTTRRLCVRLTQLEKTVGVTQVTAFLVLPFNVKVFSSNDHFSALFSQAKSGPEAQVLLGICSGPGVIPTARLPEPERPTLAVKSMSIN